MGAGHDMAKGKKRVARRHNKRKPIAEGDRVWLLRDNTMVHGEQPGVVPGVVHGIGREKHTKQLIYNCLNVASGQRNTLACKDEIRPFTDQGKAELLRLLVHRLGERAHHFRQVANSCLDLVSVFLLQISDLEGKK